MRLPVERAPAIVGTGLSDRDSYGVRLSFINFFYNTSGWLARECPQTLVLRVLDAEEMHSGLVTRGASPRHEAGNLSGFLF